ARQEEAPGHRQLRRTRRRCRVMEAFLALLRDQFDGAGKIVRGIDEARLAGTLHPDRHIRDVRFGRPCDDGGRADQTDEPLCCLQSGLRHVPSIGTQVPQIPDEYHSAVERLLPRPATAPRYPEGGHLRIEGRKAATAWRWSRGKIIYSCARSWPGHSPR